MRFGLTDTEITFLNVTLLDFIRGKGGKVWVFGSRAKGHHHPFSDVDLLIELPLLRTSEEREIKDRLEQIKESHFPYKVDLVKLEQLAEAYRDSVFRERIEFV